MTIEQAIKKAIEVGYVNVEIIEKPTENYIVHLCNYKTFLDPQFWQSLGKAMGWRQFCKRCDNPSSANSLGACDLCEGMESDRPLIGRFELGWLYQWHKFIDHLAEGKNIESYFENL